MGKGIMRDMGAGEGQRKWEKEGLRGIDKHASNHSCAMVCEAERARRMRAGLNEGLLSHVKRSTTRDTERSHTREKKTASFNPKGCTLLIQRLWSNESFHLQFGEEYANAAPTILPKTDVTYPHVVRFCHASSLL
jgi:hypothetical protein